LELRERLIGRQLDQLLVQPQVICRLLASPPAECLLPFEGVSATETEAKLLDADALLKGDSKEAKLVRRSLL
jgi:hypothetical protein